MTLSALGPVEVTQIVRQARAKKDVRAIGVHAIPVWAPGPELVVDAQAVRVVPCSSPLAARQALLDGDEHIVVLLTDCSEAELGDDVMADLRQHHLVQPDRWKAVQGLFHAAQLDPVLTRTPWLADALIDAAPTGGYPPVPSGVLDLDTAMSALASAALGIHADVVDLESLVGWAALSVDPGMVRASDEARAGIRTWATTSWGSAAGVVLDLVAAHRSADVVPLGLVAQVLYCPPDESAPQPDPITLTKAQTLLGVEIASTEFGEVEGRSLADAVGTLVRQAQAEGNDGLVSTWLARGTELLSQVDGEALVEHSDLLPAAFDRRIDRAADLATAVLGAPSAANLPAIDHAVEAVRRHLRAERRAERVAALEMAVRLMRRLATSVEAAPATSLAVAAGHYADEGAFVDWARTVIAEGDSASQPLAELCRLLGERYLETREAENKRFAELLVGLTETGSSAGTLLPVEQILEVVVAPLAHQRPVLLLVMDGMSHAVAREVLEDLRTDGWIEQQPTLPAVGAPVLAMLPTVTNVSRASLFCGAPTVGAQPVEAKGFAAHPALRAANGNKPPQLFHKIDVSASGGQAIDAAARQALADPSQKVVGIVINSVDDHLKQGELIRVAWGLRSIRPLAAVLDACREADRAIVLTSDHGHILGRTIPQRTPADPGGERWRPASSPPAADEVELAGPRVLTGNGRIVAPWTERLRYSSAHAGYHGGATPQEALIPLTVLTAGDVDLDGWIPSSPGVPEWWNPPVAAVSEPPAPTPAPPPRKARAKAAPAGQQDLFGEPTASDGQAVPAGASTMERPAWLDELVASGEWADQRARSGRVNLEDDRAQQILALIDQAGGLSSLAALARATGTPELRMRGLVTALRRLVNVEGYDVVSLEPDGTVRLDKRTLAVQFGLDEVGA